MSVLLNRNLKKSNQSEPSITTGVVAPEFAERLNGVDPRKINGFLIEKNWLFESLHDGLRVTSYAINKYMGEEPLKVRRGDDEFIVYKPVLLERGMVELTIMYFRGALDSIMSQDWDRSYFKKVSTQ